MKLNRRDFLKDVGLLISTFMIRRNGLPVDEEKNVSDEPEKLDYITDQLGRMIPTETPHGAYSSSTLAVLPDGCFLIYGARPHGWSPYSRMFKETLDGHLVEVDSPYRVED